MQGCKGKKCLDGRRERLTLRKTHLLEVSSCECTFTAEDRCGVRGSRTILPKTAGREPVNSQSRCVSIVRIPVSTVSRKVRCRTVDQTRADFAEWARRVLRVGHASCYCPFPNER